MTAIINENIMVAVIPVAVKLNIPVNNPNNPASLAFNNAPWINECPKEVITTIAPAPNFLTKKSYIPNISKNAPTTTNNEVTSPGFNLVKSINSCPIKQTTPANKNEYI